MRRPFVFLVTGPTLAMPQPPASGTTPSKRSSGAIRPTPASERYVIVSPCRNEAAYMRRTLDSVLAQSIPPALWVIVDDGSTDETPQILADYAARHPTLRIVQRPDRGTRAVGPGVIEAFYDGLDTVDLGAFDYLCKLDLDLDLPPGYFAGLLERMAAEPRLGTCSGMPWFTGPGGQRISEKCGPEMSVGMTKFYRKACFEEIGGFVRAVMWDAIDCHRARQMGWTARAFADPALAFEHLRPMGSSDKGVLTGRRRHGAGQFFMGSDPLYFAATAVYRMAHPPYLLGGLAMLQGYASAWARGAPQLDDPGLRAFIRRYQRRALRVGKARAIAEIEAAVKT
ncbi:MAG: glycosyltransferase [Pseudomonadota bacterium]